MPESFVLTRLLIKLFGGLLAAGIHAVGVAPEKAAARAAEILNAFSLELLVAAGLIAFFVFVRLRSRSKSRVRRSILPR